MRPLAVVLASTVGAVPSLSRADVVADPDEEIARRHFQAGLAQYAEARYEEALREFQRANLVRPSAAFDYNIARCLDRLERLEEAVRAYERYLAASPASSDAPEVKGRIAILQARLAAVPSAAAVAAVPSVAAVAAVRPAPRRSLVAPLAVGGAALAAAVLGTGLLASIPGDYDRLFATRPHPPSDYAGLEARAYAGYAAFGVAGALLVVDLALWAVQLRRPGATR